MPVNPNYNTFPLVHYYEAIYGDKFKELGERSSGLLWLIRQKERAAFRVQDTIDSGLRALLKISLEDSQATGQSYTGEWPGTLTLNAPTQKNTYAQYPVTGLKTSFQLTSRDQMASDAYTKASRFGGEVDGVLTRFRNKIASDIEGNANASETTLLGIRYANDRSNTDVGNVNDPLFLPWRDDPGSNRALTTSLVTQIAHKADRWRRTAEHTDVILFEVNAGSLDLYGRFFNLVSSDLTFIGGNADPFPRVSLWQGAHLFPLTTPVTGSAGSIWGLTSETWVFAQNPRIGDMENESSFEMQITPVPGNTLVDYTFSVNIAWGTNDRASNGEARKITNS